MAGAAAILAIGIVTSTASSASPEESDIVILVSANDQMHGAHIETSVVFFLA